MSDRQELLDDKKRAFYTVLAAAALVDGKLRPLEAKELDALMARTRTLSQLPPAVRDQLRIEVVRKLRKSFESDGTRYDRIREACHILTDLEKEDRHHNDGLCRAAFLHALDLTHADDYLTPKRRGQGPLDPKEEEFLRHIAKWLGVAWRAGAAEDDLMRLKNSI
jgi:tellurite resistance protein